MGWTPQVSLGVASKYFAKFVDAFCLRLYESLTLNDSPQPVDLIFVMAGRMERKCYGLELYRAGTAPIVALSVGRFEVSRMSMLDREVLDELKALRDRTPPAERHFFICIDRSGVHLEKAVLPRWSTYGEAVAFRRFWEVKKARSVMVVSTDVHLRRTALAFDEAFRGAPVEFRYCPLPSSFGFVQKSGWWTRRDDRRFVLRELVKLAGYRAIFLAPHWAIRRLMRLKN
jgi:hypothetical protein